MSAWQSELTKYLNSPKVNDPDNFFSFNPYWVMYHSVLILSSVMVRPVESAPQNQAWTGWCIWGWSCICEQLVSMYRKFIGKPTTSVYVTFLTGYPPILKVVYCVYRISDSVTPGGYVNHLFNICSTGLLTMFHTRSHPIIWFSAQLCPFIGIRFGLPRVWSTIPSGLHCVWISVLICFNHSFVYIL